MADIESVRVARKQVVTAYNTLLKGTSGLKISEVGLKFKHEDLQIDSRQGVWTDNHLWTRNTVWLVNFQYDPTQALWVAGMRPAVHDNHNRLTGSFNAGSPLQGLLVRTLPAIRTTPIGIDASTGTDQWITHPYWEWSLVFVFPGEAVFSKRRTSTARSGSSGTSLDLDLQNGVLTPNVGAVAQPYVAASLFTLVADDDSYTVGEMPLRYADLTQALKSHIHVAPAEPELSAGNGGTS